MAAGLYEWIRTLTYFFILVTAILQVLPDSGYRRYIRFFTGLVLVCLMLTPILHFFGQESPVLEFFQSKEYEQKMAELEERAEELKTRDFAKEGDADGEDGGHDFGEVEEIRIGR